MREIAQEFKSENEERLQTSAVLARRGRTRALLATAHLSRAVFRVTATAYLETREGSLALMTTKLREIRGFQKSTNWLARCFPF